MKINTLELENVKRIKAVKLEPAANGLTIIGGDNNQGKTSVLDAIAWALGGNKFKPSVPAREGALVPPYIHVELDNGIVVERTGKNSLLKVTDAQGNKSGQTLLNEFISQLALDLPAFLKANDKEKADTLLQIIGVKDQLTELENEEKRLYFQRTEIGRIRDTKRKAVQNMEEYPGTPKEPISALDLIQEQQNILAKNGENQRLRMQVSQMESEQAALAGQIDMLQRRLVELQERKEKLDKDIEVGRKSVEQLHDESTAEIEASLANIEAINTQIRKNREKAKAVD
ncbi:MAG: AAA family ATPase, partial [Succiniclasticum sp.]|nr:AAA family ATPase [Succiniclasticum sp.]